MMLISDKGTLVRSRTEEVSIVSRNTQGVRLIKLSQENELLVGVERIDEPEPEEEFDEDGSVIESSDVANQASDASGASEATEE